MPYGLTLLGVATQMYRHDGRTLMVDVPMRQLERVLSEPGPHVVECIGITESDAIYGPTRVLVDREDVRLLVDSEARRDLAGWDIIDSDEDVDD